MAEFIARLKQRKLVQWALAYIAAAFALIQVIDVVASRFDWPMQLERSIILALAVGFVIALVIAWYHGEKGRQRASGPELLLLALVLAIGGGVVWYFGRGAVQPIAEPTLASSAAKAPGASSVAATEIQAQPIPAKSIAVLPFVNMSGDPKNDYFSDGITEEILDALAQVPNLKVAARTSAFAFKGKTEDLRKVGEVLDVATVLEGSVQKSGDEVRITAQLIDTRSGYHLWSEKYDRKLTSVFAVEDEISKSIADKLQVQLAGGSASTLVAQKTIDPRAHDFYLHGLPLIAARGPALREAVADFQQAVAIDPDYAQAWAALAEAQLLLPHYFLEPQGTAAPAGEAAARRALAIDPDVASAYVALGMHYRVQWRWQDADAAFRKALKIAPGDAEAADQYGQYLLAAGRLQDALAEIERARKLDPLSGIIGVTRANVLTALHRYDDATVQARRVTELRPDYALGHFVAADVALYRHDYTEAKAQLDTGARIAGENPDLYSRLVDGIADPAKRAAAREAVVTATADARQRLTRTARIKWLMLLGDRDDALEALQSVGHELMFGQDNVWQPAFDPIRNDPRFKAVLKKMGLPYMPKDAAAP
ncbi:MAG: Adenylate cyclase [Rhodanobacteraceae bacterium]|jgi:TolB-like protein/Tfp pilus assembly protein PilF|nr:MAG: Adenylate cyclase [Rhodanobacteraceae bacterium]